ncbi:aminotransferase class III-fold pyridoxal phosphate-dependent enzyme [Actinobacteria bacterium YIM 96077]|uniref:Aspartate aminotransferase family protein n=1 Tax=Phytoactinopolyspora halophila TaxID=1981511 RepID=A0A329R3G0_9ACTN|nr:aminotransferase class III-fold pyridoxal phosphate-dependent enzyme [Phytoactinopolyspora halophila]AYY13255.1 aminotransferase class III-fold pyridoxal phosphate-dependent enzyme [Actinobacteria bacterium YIM 96077]RAW17508.1 aspartate aminotransferase family protein [Phytoactinopolyspora halophila]
MSLLTRTRSAELAERAREITPGGVHSNVRLAGPSVFFERGEGAWLYDEDGNDYIDYLLGQGPIFLGHAPRQVTDAVAREMRRGSVFAGQHTLENRAGELFLESVDWAEKVRFGVTGTETDQAALRLARAATGRTRFVRFAGTYHGWLDNVLITTVDGVPRPASAGQLSRHLDDSYVLPYNDTAALETLLDQDDDIAAVIVEPVLCNSGAILPVEGYLHRLRELCDQHGVVLIFDEVITGFRLALGGAAEYFGVTPDLAVYGKAMAGGWPVSALAGSATLMDLFADGVTHAGTFNSSVPACAAVVSTLTLLREDPPYGRVHAHGTKLMDSIRELAVQHDLPLRVQGLPVAFHVSFGSPGSILDHAGLASFDLDRYAAFSHTLADHGIWVAPRGIWYVSAAHGDVELSATLERLDAALSVEAACGQP